MFLSDECVHPAGAFPDLDRARLVTHRLRPSPARWGGLAFEIRNHEQGWISVIRGSQPTDTGHPILCSEWASPPREFAATAVRHGLLEVAELAVCRAAAEALTATACTTKRWDDNNRIAISEEPGSDRWMTAWLHNGSPGFSSHDSWREAHIHAAEQLDSMAESFILAGGTWGAQVASAQLRRSANQVRDLVLTADLGDAVRDGAEAMRHERSVTRIASGLGVQRTFLYRVFHGEEWTAKAAPEQKPAVAR
jgi:hypothetical protein